MPLASSSILNVLLVRIAVAYLETVISTWKTDYRTAKLVSDVSKNIFCAAMSCYENTITERRCLSPTQTGMSCLLRNALLVDSLSKPGIVGSRP